MKQKYDYYFLHGKSLNFLQILQKLLVEAIYLIFRIFQVKICCSTFYKIWRQKGEKSKH